MAVKKSSNHSTKKIKTETGGPLVKSEYRCLKEYLPRYITASFLENIARQLIEWSDDSDSIHITDFYQGIGMPKSTFYEWTAKDANMKEAYEYAIDAIGARREKGAITKKYDTGAVWRRQYQFGEEYKAAMIFAAMLAKKEDENAGNKEIKVIVPDIRTVGEMLKNMEREKE